MEKEFTKQAERVLQLAKSFAKKFHHPYVGTEHLLLSLKQEFTGVAGQVLAMNGVKFEEIEKVNQNLIDAGIPEEHIQMIPDEEDPKQGKIRVDADDAIILKEYLATLGIDLEEEIGAELIADEEESEEKEDDSEEGEEKKDDDKEVNDDDVEISADDIFGDM